MVWIEPPAAVASVSPVFNDLDLLVVGYKETSDETTFYPNNFAANDPDNTVEVVSIHNRRRLLRFVPGIQATLQKM